MSELAYEDIKVGDEASLARTITEVHIVNYAGITGDMNPIHTDEKFAKSVGLPGVIAHGMLQMSIAAVVAAYAPPEEASRQRSAIMEAWVALRPMLLRRVIGRLRPRPL